MKNNLLPIFLFFAILTSSCHAQKTTTVTKQNPPATVKEKKKEVTSQETLPSDKKKKKKRKKKWDLPPLNDDQLMTVEEQRALLATDEEMEWFKNAKFGVFVHWGPAVAVTTTLSWGRYGERPGAGKPAKGGVPPEIYDNAYKEFNPVDFNAEQWMKQIKSWGAKYITFTTKHHDGFCMFDAPNTDYDIEHTPFKRDIAKEIADAAHKYGIKLFWYYSQPDWTHPDCLRKGRHYESYLPYMEEQITHLLTNYGKIDGIFFDGLGSKYWHWDMKHLIPKIKKLQPGILINPRMGFGFPDPEIRGDYDTPEQGVGPIDHNRYWESCITVTGKWLYDPKGPIKSGENMIQLLVQAVGNGGNLLLNFGPSDKGIFVEKEAKQAEKLGKFLKKYGHTLYDTRRGIYISGDWGTSTQKGNKLYLHFLKKFAKGAEPSITLPPLPMKIISAKGLTPGFKNYDVSDKGVTFHFLAQAYNKNVDNIVELTLAESPTNHERIPTWTDAPLKIGKDFTVEASSEKKPKNTAKVIFNAKKNVFSEGIHLKKWWQPEKDDKQPFFQINLKAPQKVSLVYISEQIRSYNIKDFGIEIQTENGNWEEVFRGKYIGNGFRLVLPDKKIRAVRLKVYKSNKEPRISTFNLF